MHVGHSRGSGGESEGRSQCLRDRLGACMMRNDPHKLPRQRPQTRESVLCRVSVLSSADDEGCHIHGQTATMYMYAYCMSMSISIHVHHNFL